MYGVKTAKAMYRNASFFVDAILILNRNLNFNYISILQFLDLRVIFASKSQLFYIIILKSKEIAIDEKWVYFFWSSYRGLSHWLATK
jgi:hypothetical protein